MPAYEAVASTFRPTPSTPPNDAAATPILIARIDVDKHRHFAKRFNLFSFPTVKYFPSTPQHASLPATAQGTAYLGGVDAASMVQFVNERAGTDYALQQRSTWVRSLVPKVFEAVALDPTRHVLVQFHAPWCTECGSFSNIWETVGKTFRSDGQHVVLASVNAEKYRELGQQQDVTSYPTVKYYPGYEAVEVTPEGSSGGLPGDVSGAFARTYNGGMTSQDLVDFINDVAGLDRVVGGDIHREAGRSKELNAAAGVFVGALRSGRVQDAERVVSGLLRVEIDKVCGSEGGGSGGSGGLQCKGARLFESVMGKMLGHVDGVGWGVKERRRLEALVRDEDVNHVQRTAMMLKRNVLEAFEE